MADARLALDRRTRKPASTTSRSNPIGRAVAAFGARQHAPLPPPPRGSLGAPLVVIVAALLFAAGSVVAYRSLPEELTPQEDRGVVPISISTPQGVTIEYTDAEMRKIEAIAQPYLKSGEATASSPSPAASAAAPAMAAS